MNVAASFLYKGKRHDAIRQLVQNVAHKHGLNMAVLDQDGAADSDLKIEIKNPHLLDAP